MLAHEERVLEESKDPNTKLDALSSFITNYGFGYLPVEEQTRLKRQELIMKLYAQVLEERIANF